MKVEPSCGLWWRFFVFCEACPPSPHGRGGGGEGGFGEFFVFGLFFVRVIGALRGEAPQRG